MENSYNYTEKAVEYLMIKGYGIISRMVSTRYGVIDLIGSEAGFPVFVDIEFDGFIDLEKRKSLKKSAFAYAREKKLEFYRFDIIKIKKGKDFFLYHIEKGAFS